MFDVDKYKDTMTNLDEAKPEDKVELVLVAYGVGSILFMAPAIYFLIEDPLISGIIALIGVLDLAMSQYLPERLNFEEESTEEKKEY